MDIFVKVDGQKIVLPTNMKVVTGSSNFVKLVFTLATDWDNMSVKAIFTQIVNGERVDTKKTLDEYNSCYVPSTLEEGRCVLTLYGVGGIGGISPLYFTIVPRTFGIPKGSTGFKKFPHVQA